MEYVKRTYREHFEKERWHHFLAGYKETDLWIGIDKASWNEDMPAFAEQQIRQLRGETDEWLKDNPEYGKALVSYPAKPDAPVIFHEMSAVAEKSGIGPMSAVAGAFARYVGLALKQKYNVKEIIVENGGDIYADITEDIDIAVFAGASPLSEKAGLHIEAAFSPLGICTSAGTVGPSLSFGKADAVMIVCRDVALADTYATAFANLIQTAGDINGCIEKINEKEDIIAAMIIKDDKMGVCGKFEMRLFTR